MSLVYAAITSLDGYVADAGGGFDWAAPDEEVHAAVNDLVRHDAAALYGRRMYEVLRVWQDVEDGPPVIRDYAQIWRSMDKIVVSTTLDAVATPRTRLVRSLVPDDVRHLVETSEGDVSIGGPTLAGHALRAGIVDEIHLFVHPVVVGGGLRALPDGVRLDLELADEHRFSSGVVHLHHRVARAGR
ncbi:dihydrofolate reductase family protein [Cellulomonas sp. PhB143]|uniref:dihydrofolate reductase family protein n=1 Tax=Cellulomonas sp. PhB143 TaxID=2485186 RepID=UPI000F492CEF|nr:dihydrofolate reductase family protein [Cellulomonas sp. PhB143]ROS72099.1 dihydrofolate reductase [Cellulomonas sp. PhB143]